MKEIFIILAHPSNPIQKKFLRGICNQLSEAGKHFLVASHLPIPNDISDIATITYTDVKNRLLYDGEYKGFLSIGYPSFYVESKNFFSYNSTLAVYDLMMPSFVLAKMNGYNIAHLIEYDSIIDSFVEFEKNSKTITEEDIDVIIYNKDRNPDNFFMAGEFNTWNLDKFNLSDFYFTDKQLMDHIKIHLIGEQSTYFLLIKDRKHLVKRIETIEGIKVGLNHSEESKWTSLVINNNTVMVYSENRDKKDRELMVVYNDRSIVKIHETRKWEYFTLGQIEEIKMVDIFIDRKHLCRYDLSTPESIEKIKYENAIIFH